MNWELIISKTTVAQMTSQAGLVAFFALLVLVATFVDLFSAIRASKYIGCFKTHSFGLRRTFRKQFEYLSVMVLILFIDFGLLHLSNISDTVGLFKIFQTPLVSIVIFIMIMATEVQSVRENIEIRKGSGIIPDKTINMLSDMIDKIGDSGNKIDAKSVAAMLKVVTQKQDKNENNNIQNTDQND